MVHDLQVYLLMLPDQNAKRQTQVFLVASLCLIFRGCTLVTEQTCLQTPEANSLRRIMWSVVMKASAPLLIPPQWSLLLPILIKKHMPIGQKIGPGGHI
mgnify:CR=1 FL=1